MSQGKVAGVGKGPKSGEGNPVVVVFVRWMSFPRSPSPSSPASRFSPTVTRKEVSDHPIIALIPTAPDTRLEDFEPLAEAQEECTFYQENAKMGDIQSEVEIVKDAELGIDVIDLAGPQARIVVPCRAPLRYLIAHIKDMGQFSTITVTVVDNQKRIRRLNFSSRTSHAKIEQDAASLPLLLEDHAWNYLCLDLENMCHVAFGAPYAYCKEVCVTATCALGRLFFTDKKYEDVELPPFLRVLQ